MTDSPSQTGETSIARPIALGAFALAVGIVATGVGAGIGLGIFCPILGLAFRPNRQTQDLAARIGTKSHLGSGYAILCSPSPPPRDNFRNGRRGHFRLSHAYLLCSW